MEGIKSGIEKIINTPYEDKQNFDLIVSKFNKSFHLVYKSRPLNYLPQNSFFSDKIKIRLVVLKKI